MIYSTPFVIHDLTGNIIRTGSCPDFLLSAQAGPGEMVLEGAADAALQYIDIQTGTAVDKAHIAPVISGLVLSALPIPCMLYVEESAYEITDGEATLSFDLPGTYSVIIAAQKMIPAVVEVTQP